MDATLNMPTVLVVLAHPDDESFPMGGPASIYAAHAMDAIDQFLPTSS